MDESTTTAPTEDQGVVETQPEDTSADNAAENQTTEPVTDQGAEQEPVKDENLSWLQENKGIDPSTPEGVAKLAQMYREAEKRMHDSTAEKAQLQTALQQPTEYQATDQYTDPTEQLAAEVSAMKLERTVEKFWATNPDAKEYESKMTEMVVQNPALAEMVKNNYLSVENLYQMAKGADPNRESTLKTEGGREALQKVADKQQARAVTPQATSSSMGTPQVTKANVDAWYAGLSPTERAKPETQQIVSSLLS